MQVLRLRGLLKEVNMVDTTKDHVLAKIKFMRLQVRAVL
jgi:hypothetical protein